MICSPEPTSVVGGGGLWSKKPYSTIGSRFLMKSFARLIVSFVWAAFNQTQIDLAMPMPVASRPSFCGFKLLFLTRNNSSKHQPNSIFTITNFDIFYPESHIWGFWVPGFIKRQDWLKSRVRIFHSEKVKLVWDEFICPQIYECTLRTPGLSLEPKISPN